MSSAHPVSGISPPADFDLLRRFALYGRFPLRSPCPNGCAFCYERDLNRLIPAVKLARMPKLTDAAFDYYLEQVAAYRTLADPGASEHALPDGGLLIYSFSDFFSQSLSIAQIERLFAHNEQFDPLPWLYTSAMFVEPEEVRHLCANHPASMKIYLSLFTFNDDIKRQLIPRWPGSAKLRQIIPLLSSPIVYLTYFGHQQTLTDLRELDGLVRPNTHPTVIVARLHYNTLQAPIVRRLGDGGLAEFPRTLRHLLDHRHEFPNLPEIVSHYPAAAFAWHFREPILARLRPLNLAPDDVVLCSRGAAPVLERILKPVACRVLPVNDPLGGSTSITTTITTEGVIARLRELVSDGGRLRRVIAPSSMWTWDGRCLQGGTPDDVRQHFPGVELVVVEIPPWLLRLSLTLEECWSYYAGLERDADWERPQ